MSVNQYISIREIDQSDLHFIFNSFTASLSKYHESFFHGWNPETVNKYLELLIIWALDKGPYSVFVACSKDDEKQIIGYSIVNNTLNEVFFNYTKYSYRKLGVQKLLLNLSIDLSKPVIVNWATKEMLKLAKANKVNIKQQFVENILIGALNAN